MEPDAEPAPRDDQLNGDWAPYENRLQFEVADLLYAREQMGASNIDALLELWRSSLLPQGGEPPFENHVEMYRAIDSTPLGDVRWQCFTMQYSQDDLPQPASSAPTWMTDTHEVWYRDVRMIVKNMLSNPDFKTQLDYAPLREFSADGLRQVRNFMSGEWAWRQAVSCAYRSTMTKTLTSACHLQNILQRDRDNHGAMFVPIVLGSDKTTVSVATGQNDYYPLYVSIGNVHNTVRRAHKNAVALAAFLAIPKGASSPRCTPVSANATIVLAVLRKYKDDAVFRKFRRQLFHASLSRILQSLTGFMEHPEVVLCSDGHYRKAIYGIGPYIADYPEQALIASIVQGWCPT